MANTLDLAAVFRRDAEELRRARERAIGVHPTDISAAGKEVEDAVRAYFRRMLPPRYHVTSGHLIDSNERVSPQIDIIIADNFGVPSLLTTSDGTEYVPISSALAIGEVKSTYYKSKRYHHKMRDDLKAISMMNRPLIENTAYDGIKGHTLIHHMFNPSATKYLNSLYSFLFCVDGGDFDFGAVSNLLRNEDPLHLPATTVLLNKGLVAYGNMDVRGRLSFHKYPREVSRSEYDWCVFEGIAAAGGSRDGTHLAYLYGCLIQHLANCRLGSPDIDEFTSKMSRARKSSLLWAKAEDV